MRVDEPRAAARAAACVLSAGLACGPAIAGELKVDGVVSALGVGVEGQPSWLDGGFGRLPEGAAGAGASDAVFRAAAHLGVDWKLSESVRFHAHGVARGRSADSGFDDAGLVEAFFLYRPELTPTLSLSVRAGTFFPSTSRENVDRLWSSPYTVTFSALNSWIGEEQRPSGIEVSLVRRNDRRDQLVLAGGVYGADDTAGTLLAWRGWTMGDYLTVAGDTLPLPPLRSLAPGGAFDKQRDDGTKPIAELDGRLGWGARARWDRPGVVLVQGAYRDNRGDRGLHRGEYAWRTRFGQAGLELSLGRGLRLIAEAAQGRTGMGPLVGTRVDIEFKTVYALLSWGSPRFRLSLRYDHFENAELDGTAEPNQERGNAWTAAAFFQPRPFLRLGVELLDLKSQRPAASDSGFDPDTDARHALVELRLLF